MLTRHFVYFKAFKFFEVVVLTTNSGRGICYWSFHST